MRNGPIVSPGSGYPGLLLTALFYPVRLDLPNARVLGTSAQNSSALAGSAMMPATSARNREPFSPSM